MISFLLCDKSGMIENIWWEERMDMLNLVYSDRFSILELRQRREELTRWMIEHEPKLTEKARKQVKEMMRYLGQGIERQERRKAWLAQCEGHEVDPFL